MIKTLDEVLTDYEFVNILKEKYPKESESEMKEAFESFDNHCVFIADDLSDFVFSYSGEIILAKKVRGVENGKFTEDQLKYHVATSVFRAYNNLPNSLFKGLVSNKPKLVREGNPMFGEKEFVYTELFYEYMMDLQMEAMDSYLESVNFEVEYPFSYDDIPKEFTSDVIELYNRFMDEIYDILELHCENFNDMGRLIHEDYWIKHCEEEIKEAREIFDIIPYWVEVDIKKTAEKMKTYGDYGSMTIDGETWFYKKDLD